MLAYEVTGELLDMAVTIERVKTRIMIRTIGG
jgi:hypothetical protein